jgi:phosphoglucomutase
MSVIKFGTSGWRGIISDTFTFANVELAAHAIARYLHAHPPPNARKTVIVGHDTRFLSREFAMRCAAVIAGHGFETLLTNRDAPTPVIAHAVRRRRAAAGVNITASHNPPEWNGLKFNGADGAPAPPETTRAIEKIAAELEPGLPALRLRAPGPYRVFDPRPDYLAQVRKLADFKLLRRRPKSAVLDLMFGTGRGYLDELLRQGRWRLLVLHAEPDPLFGDGHPEPIREHMGELLRRMKSARAALGLGLDPDADRFAVVDRDGTFINANQVLALTLYHLVKNRRWTGAVVRTVATSHLVDAVAGLFGVPVRETPVGFKYIGALMQSEPVIVGGEESGGLSVKNHVPEKDGILACLLMAELVACEGQSLGAILRRIHKQTGPLVSDRINLRVTEAQKEQLMKRFGNGLVEFAGHPVRERIARDGYKFILDDRRWVMFRPSGTEPVFRCYLEARNARELARFKRAALELVK